MHPAHLEKLGFLFREVFCMSPNGFYAFHLVVAKVFSQMLQVVYGGSILVMSGVCVCVCVCDDGRCSYY